jgi:hypothetical protein
MIPNPFHENTICFHEMDLGSYDNIIGEDWLEFQKSKVDYNRE